MSDDVLYIGCNGTVAAIRVSSGEELWRSPLLEGMLSPTMGHDVCLIEHSGRIYAGCRGHLFCLDAATGDPLWENALRGMGYNEVTLAMAGKSVQFVSSHTKTTE